MEFKPFPKIKRLFREIVITEKIDGTNASVFIPTEEEQKKFNFARKVMAASRTRWIEPGDDNYGFASWVDKNYEELLRLGPGYHFGEWWGKSIQRGYGLSERRFSLFNVEKWSDDSVRPSCCSVVPTLYRGEFDTNVIKDVLIQLSREGSKASPGFMDVEGVCIFHTASNSLFKYTLDDNHKDVGK